MLIIRGKNFFPNDIENHVQNKFPEFVRHSGAIFQLDSEYFDMVVLVQEIQRNLDSSTYPELVAKAKAEILEEFGFSIDEVHLVKIGTITKTTSGKIQRLKTKKRYIQHEIVDLNKSKDSVKKESATEEAKSSHANQDSKAIEKIIFELLPDFIEKDKVIELNASNSFAHYGLTSISSVQLISKLSEKLDMDIDPTLLWEYNSIASLSEYLAGEQQSQEKVKQDTTTSIQKRPDSSNSKVDISLLFFASDESEFSENKYEFFNKSCLYADDNHFKAVWIPERHFHRFGGLYPNPSVLASSLTSQTKNIRLRSGSVVLPLNNPVRVAEEWSVVDNLSNGRVDIGFAQGWNVNDYVLEPNNYENRLNVMYDGIDKINKLWRGEEITLKNGRGEDKSFSIYPLPKQKELNIWITSAGSDERFAEAGKSGANILTALLFQSADELARKIKIYKDARKEAGFDPDTGIVTLMLHTFVHNDHDFVRSCVKKPFTKYLEDSISLWSQVSIDLKSLSPKEKDQVLDMAFERYYRTATLFGSVEEAVAKIESLHECGVDEIACLMDFGVPAQTTFEALEYLNQVNQHFNPQAKVKSCNKSLPTFKKATPEKEEEIAIIGMGLNFPGARTAEDFWNNLKAGKNNITEPPENRFQADPQRKNFKGGFVDNIEQFDHSFFNISSKEALLIDPQQRHFLESSWKCLQDAGYKEEDYNNKNVGVYVGVADVHYNQLFKDSQMDYDAHMLAGNTVCTLPSRVSYYLNLKGPCLSIDTACSSSLVAVHKACQAIRHGDCDEAIAGGVSFLITSDLYHIADKANMLSKKGNCHTFSDQADGYIPGEGAGAILLKPLSKAIEDGNTIYGVIKGSAINQDGKTNGITAPNMESQSDVLKDALKKASLRAGDVDYIECHGTGTQLGDPIEAKAIARGYESENRDASLKIGSVKTNIGHLLAGAGIASIIKVLLSLKHKELAPSINYQNANDRIDFANNNLEVVQQHQPWINSNPRKAGISGFGHSGTNCHILIEEAPEVKHTQAKNKDHLIVLSAPSSKQLASYIKSLLLHLNTHKGSLHIQDVSHTLNTGRTVYKHKFACTANSLDTLISELITAIGNNSDLEAKCFEFFKNNNQKDSLHTQAWEYLNNNSLEETTGKRISLPTFPLQPSKFWIDVSIDEGKVAKTSISKNKIEDKPSALSEPESPNLSLETISKDIVQYTSELVNEDIPVEDYTTPFIEIGADSIILMDLIHYLNEKYHLKIQVSDLFENVDTLEKIAQYVSDNVAGTNKKVEATPTPVASKIQVETKTSQASSLPAWANQKNTSVSKAIDPEFIATYSEKTKTSKHLAERYRTPLADNRNVAGFRPSVKKILYPIVANSGKGCRITDVDGNQYIDITMGFGVHLLGHNPGVLQEALKQATESGFLIGPQSDLAGKVAELLCEVTGNERASFFNSGTEAVMTAIRLARHNTKKSKILIFKNSYHGHSDGVLASGDNSTCQPAISGITAGSVQDVLMADYNDSALDLLNQYQDDIAAVLVEPAQARNPDTFSIPFLKQLREWTTKHNSALIFDEMITGFRIAMGGFAEFSRIQPDMATYGKIVGGGMPIGVVAGKSNYMDAIDGGAWNFQDDSTPSHPMTFVAGTFSKHPITMQLSYAILKHLKEHKDTLYPTLNENTKNFAQRLNTIFQSYDLPIQVKSFGSLFRFDFKQNLDLFFYKLVDKGIYIWEGRNCFLSTAHSLSDINAIVETIESVCKELTTKNEDSAFPALKSQAQLCSLFHLDPEKFAAYNESFEFTFSKDLDLNALENTIDTMVQRHQILRLIFSEDMSQLQPYQGDWKYLINLGEMTKEQFHSYMSEAKPTVFNPFESPLFYTRLIRVEENWKFLVQLHHVISDGLSLAMFLDEFSKVYTKLSQGQNVSLPAGQKYSNFVYAQTEYLKSESAAQAKEHWNNHLKNYTPFKVANQAIHSDAPVASFVYETMSLEHMKNLKEEAKKNKVTFFQFLLSLYAKHLHHYLKEDDVVIGVPVSGRTFPETERVLGYCTHLMPIRCQKQNLNTLQDYCKNLSSSLKAGLDKQNYPYSYILKDFINQETRMEAELISVGFNLDNLSQDISFGELEFDYKIQAREYAHLDINLSISMMSDKLMLEFEFNTTRLDENACETFIAQFLDTLKNPVNSTSETPIDLEEEASFSF